ncbi:MAG: NADH-quinone oxidoreductase subunit A [Candidatus Bathyarchaeota archaeon]|nr:NADH-quinone oxidoreductase subunit A [Candidatus Bathyarchaeota archaeon]
MQTDLLISLPLIFSLSIVVGLILYLVGWMIGAKGEKTEGKVAPYACGEDLLPLKLQVNAERFLIYAVYFLVFDILAFILATSLNTPGPFPAIYALIVLMAVVILLPLLRRG